MSSDRQVVVARPLAVRDLVEDAVAWVTDPAPVAPSWAVAIAAGLLHEVTDEPPIDLLIDAAFPNGATGWERREIANMTAAFDIPASGRLTEVDPIVHAPIQEWKPSPFRKGMYAVSHHVLHGRHLAAGRFGLTDLLETDDTQPPGVPLSRAEPAGPDPEGGTRWTLIDGPSVGRQFAVWHQTDERMGFPWTFVHAVPSTGRDYGAPIIDAPMLRERTAVRAALLVVDGRLKPPDFRQPADVLPGWN